MQLNYGKYFLRGLVDFEVTVILFIYKTFLVYDF
jgi:hypothetical protein